MVLEELLKPENELKYFTPDNSDDFISEAFRGIYTKSMNTKHKYFNVAASFDIEASSFYIDDKKNACMYCWSMCINGYCMFGRTWYEFHYVLDKIIEAKNISLEKRLVIYIHNLSYEFQWIKDHFTWDKIFALDIRKPLYALTDSGIEFRCSYLQSGFSLAKLSDQLLKYHVSKKVGDLDYELIRHTKTHLTDKEIVYSLNDVRVVVAYIQEQIEAEGDICHIPLTKTGYVRRFTKNECFRNNDEEDLYRMLISNLTLTVPFYKLCKRCFMGGFTHPNPFASGKVHDDGDGIDFTSSYPARALEYPYPMSSPKLRENITPDNFNKYIKKYCCMFDIKFYNLQPKVFCDSYVSISKCWSIRDYIVNNGRVFSAGYLCTSMTEVDFKIMQEFYTWDKMEVSNFYTMQKAYLPKPIIKAILTLYNNKTKLKGVDGKEAEYQISKGMLNSIYGMMVTDFAKPEINYTGEWVLEEKSLEEAVEKYNNARNRFLYYPWGIYITAYARASLIRGILEFNEDYLYSDTDSIKCINYEKHKAWIENDNQQIINRIDKCLDYYHLPKFYMHPRDIKGKEHMIGVWDYEGHYKRFKTLGAKRYMYEDPDGCIHLTVSGLNKKMGAAYIKSVGDPFEVFNDDMYIPAEFTGKNTHIYLDEPMDGIIEDYTGLKAEFHELSGVHLEAQDYSLSLAADYVNFLKMIYTFKGGVRYE